MPRRLVDDDDVELQPARPPSEYAELAVEVIASALKDLTRDDERLVTSARAFFFDQESEPLLRLWCLQTSLDLNATRAAVRRRLEAHERQRVQAA